MITWARAVAVYLHREPVGFRKQLNWLAAVVEQEMGQSPYTGALFVFCNRHTNQVKALYWGDRILPVAPAAGEGPLPLAAARGGGCGVLELRVMGLVIAWF